MIGFIKRIKDMWTLSQRLGCVESELKELDARFERSIIEYSKQFEKKIQEMTFAYTRNLDDTKSDYLKRYLEQRMDGMQYNIDQLPAQVASLREFVHNKIEQLEHIED